jgi:hypothetical protein
MSFYLLEIKLDNNITRKDYYVYNDINKLREKLIFYLESDQGCYEVIWFGVNINLYIYNEYKLEKKYDLHNYLIYQLDEYPIIIFDSNNQPIAYDKEENVITKENSLFNEYFCIKVCNGDENIIANLNIKFIEKLKGKILEKQEIFTLKEFPQIKFHYGYNDLENGNEMSDSDSEIATWTDMEIETDDEYINFSEINK